MFHAAFCVTKKMAQPVSHAIFYSASACIRLIVNQLVLAVPAVKLSDLLADNLRRMLGS